MTQQKELTNVGEGSVLIGYDPTGPYTSDVLKGSEVTAANLTTTNSNPAWISGSRIKLGPGTTVSGGATGLASTADLAFRPWGIPVLIRTGIFEDRIELVYKEASLISSGFSSSPDRVFKEVYSCVDGKWNVSERIYGQIIPATEEDYDFEPSINS